MTDKENIKAILECYFTGFKEEIIDSACNRILEQEPCGKDINVPAEDGKKNVLDKVKTEIEKQDKWLAQAGYNAYNVDIAFNSIKRVIAESEEKE